MKKFTITTTIAVALTLTLSGIAHGHESAVGEPAPQVQELVGQGSGDCPSMSLCLYEDHDLNKDKSARIWVFPITDARTDYSLRGHAAWDQPSSGYMKAPNLGWSALLFPDGTCGFEGDREAEAISFRANDPYNSLNGHYGRAKRYGYFSKNGKWTETKRWGVTQQTLNLNDRAGCAAVGEFKNVRDLYPYVDGDM
ncbi:hypothetical protein GCM10023084_77680 [Streptomyces lacrimifluminis]|uniref:Secreted protein n=1 Tax=Streptomyces lacrimifluminis TaxID=1500077 RepID=A0A917UM82_9ACTN|nr:hypothetical protein [Streptomyces lacrimifluminis]GGJ67647.1 hypothetical protein GCM10012282_75810 [Streptomyces lacrimifluminis]